MSEHDVPEILKKRSSGKLPAEELESRILKFLSSRQIGVLATCKDNVPRATPIEFRSKGLKLFMAAEPGTKIRNIQTNANVSVGIFDPKMETTHDWLDVEGLQISGRARLIRKGDPAFLDAFRIFGKPEQWTLNWAGMMLEIIPDTIEYLCIALKLEDYTARQIWTRPA
jgi:hypothetical protein